MQSLINAVVVKDDLSKFLPKSGPIHDAIAEAQATLADDQKKQQAKDILDLMKRATTLITNTVSNLRATRTTEKMIVAKLKEIKLAIAYGNETGNFIPLMLITRAVNYSAIALSVPTDMQTIPKGWKPKNDK